MKVAIDAGHGGWSTGALGGGLVEKDLTLHIAGLVRDALVGYGIENILTRATDAFVSHRHRNRIVNESGARFMLSIHFNSNEDQARRGVSGYYWPGNEKAKDVCSRFVDIAPKQLGVDGVFDADRKRERRAHGLIGAYRAPVVLAECGYLSNRNNCNWIKQPGSDFAIARALRETILYAVEVF
jgi:N-acetylmuramoyl-L-alanine amidase